MIVIIMGLLLPLLMAAATQHSRHPGVNISISSIFIVRPYQGSTILQNSIIDCRRDIHHNRHVHHLYQDYQDHYCIHSQYHPRHNHHHHYDHITIITISVTNGGFVVINV